MAPALPTLDLLRSLTDEHVLRSLIDERTLTRAEIAARTGISKPTVSESIRRLAAAGLAVDTGERTTGRGRVGSYYALAADLGVALVASVAPDAVIAEIIDVHGAVRSRQVRSLPPTADGGDVAETLRTVVRHACDAAPGPVRLAVVSAADPVDRDTGRLVHLPDAPFPVVDLSPVDTLSSMVDGPVTVDNDINWAARAERYATLGETLDNFAYLHLGEGLGCAIGSDGVIHRGQHGIAGEVAHLLTHGPRQRAVPFTDVFAQLHLRRPGSAAIDVDALMAAVTGSSATARRVLTAVTAAVTGVLTAIVALTDPEVIILGGAWGCRPAIVDAVEERFGEQPRHAPIHAARLTSEPSLAGARHRAVTDLRASILSKVATGPSTASD